MSVLKFDVQFDVILGIFEPEIQALENQENKTLPLLLFIVAEEEISGKCQNRKTYLNCSFKRKYQTNTKKRNEEILKKYFKIFEEVFKNLQKEDFKDLISKRIWELRKGLIIRHSIKQE